MSQRDLQNLNQKMKKDLQNWLDEVSQLRTEYYALNYFTCLQLLKINKEFYKLINSNDDQISREVFLLLMSISPDLTIMKVKEVVSSTKCQLISSKSMSSSLAYDDSIHEIDIPGEFAKLTEEEKEVYDSSIEEWEFEPCMVLAAIRKFGSNEDDVVEWCLNPENQQLFINASKDESSNAEVEKSQIDNNNAVVQELIDMDFSEALSIEAVKHCGEDLTLCMEYCSSQILAKSDSASDAYTFDESISAEFNIIVSGDVEMGCSNLEMSLSDTEDSCLSE